MAYEVILPLSKAVCFVLISVTMSSPGLCIPWRPCLVPSESPWRGRVHGLGFVTGVPTYDVKVIEFQRFYELEN